MIISIGRSLLRCTIMRLQMLVMRQLKPVFASHNKRPEYGLLNNRLVEIDASFSSAEFK